MINRGTLVGAACGGIGGFVIGFPLREACSGLALNYSLNLQFWGQSVWWFGDLARLSYTWYPSSSILVNAGAIGYSTLVATHATAVALGTCAGAVSGTLVGKICCLQDYDAQERKRAVKISLLAIGIVAAGFLVYNQVLVARYNAAIVEVYGRSFFTR